MKIFLLTIFAFLALVQSQIQTRYFRLPVDHFSISDRRTFDARYYVNENFYRDDGPIFIYLQFGNASTQYLIEGNMYEIAKKEGGALISLEGRYYGESRPTSDTSLENLQWLTVYQMIADVGRFASFIKEQYFDAPVILWARSHGSTLAAWSRQKYPDVIDGAWGSSASINVIEEDVNYFPNIRETIAQFGGNDCMGIIDDAISLIEASIRNGNVSYIEERFKSCGPLDASNDDDITRFLLTIELNLGTSLSTYAKIDEMCSIIRSDSSTGNPPNNPIENFARWYIDSFQLSQGIKCSLSSNTEYVKSYEDASWEGESVRNWKRHSMWLICTQFGMFQTNEARYSLPFFRKTCAAALKSDTFLDPAQLSETIKNVKTEFGRLNRVTRLLLTQGELDPYRSLGPEHDLNPQSPVVIIPGERFTSDMSAPDETSDSEALYNIKIRIQETVHEWIKRAKLGDEEASTGQIQSCSASDKITFYSLILALFVIGLFSICCGTRLFLQCRQTCLRKHRDSNVRIEPGKPFKAFG